MSKRSLLLALPLALAACGGPEITADSYNALAEEAKEQAAARQNLVWGMKGIVTPFKLFTGEFAVKKVGIMSSMLEVFVQQVETKYSDSYSETTVWSTQSYSPAFMQAISTAFHDTLVGQLKKRGFQVVGADQMAQAPSLAELVQEFSDKEPSTRTHWMVPSKGGAKLGQLSRSALPMRKDFMAKLIKESGQDMLVNSSITMSLGQGPREDLEGVKGMWINVDLAAQFNSLTSKEHLINAGKAAKVYGAFWNMLPNAGVHVSYPKVLKTKVFIPSAAISDGAKASRMQRQYFDQPLLDAYGVLAEMQARGFRQVLAQ